MNRIRIRRKTMREKCVSIRYTAGNLGEVRTFLNKPDLSVVEGNTLVDKDGQSVANEGDFLVQTLSGGYIGSGDEKWVLKKFKIDEKFKKEEKSSFPYWFAHWCAFQVVALDLGIWKPRHLLHDIEKPWLKLVLPYSLVKKIHRKYSRHHLGYRKPEKIRWDDLIIDWECCGYTKNNAPLDARETLENYKTKDPELWKKIKDIIEPRLDALGL